MSMRKRKDQQNSNRSTTIDDSSPTAAERLAGTSFELVRNRQGQFQYFISQIIDRSERIQAQETKRSLVSRLALAAGAVGIGIWEWDISHRLLLWDQRMYEFYGLTDTTISKKLWLSRIHAEDHRALNKTLNTACTGKLDKASGEFRVLSGASQTYRFGIDHCRRCLSTCTKPPLSP